MQTVYTIKPKSLTKPPKYEALKGALLISAVLAFAFIMHQLTH
jgi:hypothetical protein